MARKIPKINAVEGAEAYQASSPVPDNLDGTDVANDRRDPIIFERDGLARTTSREIAEQFGKNHRDVLRAIDDLIEAEPSLAGGLRIFAQGFYTLPTTGPQQHREFEITRDGFALLAMGFTGKKALRFKMGFIAAFNRMEAMLQGSATLMEDQLAVLVDTLVLQRLEADPRVAVLNYCLPIDILKAAKVPSKGRRGFSNTVRSRLARYCADRDIPTRRSPETDRQMFHVDAVDAWLKQEGNHLIAERMDKIGRQGVLKLVRS